ncbi:MAG TPA: hypothetical protein VEW48_08350 [Thermoanaerobaculia bacterium]|nr:hypothetical protein [Thermoanaerobaculia bacterium]
MDAFRRRGLALACLTLFLCLGAAAPQPSQKPEDLAGSWQLNEDLSQSSHPGHPWGGEHGRMGGGGPRGGGGGGRFGRPPGESGPGDGEGFRRPPLPPGQIVAMAGGSKSLRIEVAGPQLTVSSGGDSRLVLFTDGRKVRKQQEQGDEIVRRTRWRDEHLEIETTAGKAKVNELWILTNDRKRIFATVEMEMPGDRGKMSFRRVWDRVAEDDQARIPPS